MKITIGKKTYEQLKITGRLVRKSLELQEEVDGKVFGLKEYDIIIAFIVDAFGNKFTSDDVLDELEYKEIQEQFLNICNEIGNNMNDAVGKFEKN